MATRKQRRRRAKEQRHDYVWVDDEGQEIDAPDNGQVSKRSSSRGLPGRGGRQAQAPSWQRSFKRGAIFAPIMLATVMLLSKRLTLAQQVTQTLFIVAVFIPFSYFLDRFFYRSARRRAEKGGGTPSRRGS